MAVVTLVGSLVMDGLDDVPKSLADPGQAGGNVRCWIETVEVGAADTVASTYSMARLPSNAIILPASTLYWDDLTTTGSPTVDVGVYNLSGKSDFTDDADALSNGHDVSSAGSGALITQGASISSYGQPLWDHIGSVTTDPKTDVDIKCVLADANVVGGGTMSVVIYYTE
jgi:hypothetical protein|tara:strand:- start:4852 stop:5361 length:510 start_codon:yes stop_codon:yes gene_type:complete